jgi:hypothetical protein
MSETSAADSFVLFVGGGEVVRDTHPCIDVIAQDVFFPLRSRSEKNLHRERRASIRRRKQYEGNEKRRGGKKRLEGEEWDSKCLEQSYRKNSS